MSVLLQRFFGRRARSAEGISGTTSPAPSSGAIAWVALTLYVGLVLNAPTFWRRAAVLPEAAPWASKIVIVLAEAALALALTGLVASLIALAGRWSWRVLGTLLLLVSAACAYFMTRWNVVIGYGVLSAVFTTDHDMSGEVLGLWMMAWWLLFGVLPAWWLWRGTPPPSLRLALRRPVVLLRWSAVLAGLVGVLLAGQQAVAWAGKRLASADAPDMRPTGAVAYAYVPSNWIAGSGMVASNAWAGAQRQSRLVAPAQKFRYQAATDLSDLVVVMVIGETARHDRFGLLGHSRDTTPRLAGEPNLVAFAARSCDTSTKLSLACMFVRPEGLRPAPDMGPDTVLEDNVFSVFSHLGFHIDLYAMQGEVGFYQRSHAGSYKLREVIAADPANAGQPLDDRMLLPELAASLRQKERGPRLTILHTKGSHHLYTKRYPRQFARWKPECPGTDVPCSREQLLNAFDNSILFTDHVLAEVIGQLRGRKALLVYSSDHGESIGENEHFHATPRRVAPPEQRAVPLIFWASDTFLADPALAVGWQRLRARQAAAQPAGSIGHHNLFASLLGCSGVRSADGGITPEHDLCG